MGKNKRSTPAKLILFCVFFTISVIFQSLVVISSPYMFVKVLNLITVILVSAVIGAFIREIFVLKESEKYQSE
ncbi:hypothetical protein FITA111629_15515 [Filibacter tadaridae]|uniref:Uncharacterized protein n=1 Tax=Filibacter tadaridae TaxID=2483811 RepID=A0A3P5Y0D2_9BACL|nr:hypothetical protein [Filibacter tadaridae]VDC33897.1 hypothetical protein FILTAD_03070 [Filibacter tadaridae]